MKENGHKLSTWQILMAIAAFIVVVAGMRAASEILVPFLLAVFIAIISAPPLFWLRRRGLPTILALLIVIILVLVVVVLFAGLVGTSVKDFTEDLPFYEVKLREQSESLLDWLDRLGMDTTGLELTEMFDPGVAMQFVAVMFNSLSSIFADGFLILLTVIFILFEASTFPSKLRAVMGGPKASLLPFSNFVANVKHYMVIKTWVSLATGLLVGLWLIVNGVYYPLLWGLLAFIMNYIPSIGSILAAVPAVLLAIVQLGFGRALVVAAGYVLVNVVIGSFIEPRLMGRGLGLSTLVVFLSLLFWGWVLGPVGMLLSVPLTITAKIALDSREDTRWIAILLGSGAEPALNPEAEPSEGSTTGA